MATIVSRSQVGELVNELQKQNKSIVLVGGCFDLLHEGHRQFLQEAKKYGDSLFVLLESDEMIQQAKGSNRPFQTQRNRAEQLAQLPIISSIVLLPSTMTHADYDKLVSEIKPAIIATTKGDRYRHHKERQAQQIHARVVDVIERLPEYSTTKQSKSYEYK